MTTQLPPIRPIKLTLGGTVPLADIIGRDETADSLWQKVPRKSQRINEMRRFGKTSVLRLMEHRAPTGWICVRTTVEDARCSADLMELTLGDLLAHASLGKQAREALKNIIGGLAEVSGSAGPLSVQLKPEFRTSPSRAFRDVLRSVNKQLTEHDQRLLIIWDEFPDAIRAIAEKERPAAAKDVLALFRANRERDDSERIRWVLAGSVGFHHVLRLIGGHGATLNDVSVHTLGTLSPEWTRWFVASLLLGIARTANPDEIDAIASVSGGIPFIAEMMVKHLQDVGPAASLPVTPAQADELLIDATAEESLGADWVPLLSRVDDYYGDQAELAEAILDRVALLSMTEDSIAAISEVSHSDATAREVRTLLDLLEQDHYLQYDRHTRLYSWRHRPLQTIWRALRKKV